MRTLRVTPAVLASIALAAMSIAQGAPAADTLSESDGIPRVAVSYTDLNLASPHDAKRLLQRITDAATQVCGDPTTTLDLSARARKRACISAAIARAVGTVASEKLTLAYEQSRLGPRHAHPLNPRAASIATPGR